MHHCGSVINECIQLRCEAF